MIATAPRRINSGMTRTVTLMLMLGAALAACRTAAEDAEPAPPAQAPPATTPATTPAPAMSDTSVQLTLDRATYAPGANVTLTLTNRGQRELGYNACTRIVERESNGAWTAVPEPDRICTMELRLLDRGQTVKEQTDLPRASAGRYRLAINFSDESSSAGGPLRVTSAPFEIR